MTQEEKAKAYDMALERARDFHDGPTANIVTRTFLESVFPELRESEDERIRKEIIDIVESYRSNCVYEGTHRFDECIAWLEKQKKQVTDESDKIAAAYQLGIKDKEQKSVEGLDEAADVSAKMKYPYEGGMKGEICEYSIPIFVDGFKAGAEWAMKQK